MNRRGMRLAAIALVAAGYLGACALGPDPWSPKTYPREIKPYLKDTGALGGEWRKYQIKGMEETSFFFAREDRKATIAVSFTCGKYQDIPLDLLAEHLIFPMGRKPKIIRAGYVSAPRAEVYHLLAEGDYCYQDEAVYKDLGHVPRASAEMMVDAYVVGEPHCVVDLVYAAAPADYARYVGDFRGYLASLKVPVEDND